VSGFAGTVVFTCSVPSSMSEASCSATSAQIAASSGTTSTLTVTTTEAHSIAARARPDHWMASGIGAILAGFICLGVPAVKRRRSSLLVPFILLLLLGMMSCGGNGGGGGSTSGGHTDPGTPAGTYSLTLTATSGTASHAMNVSVTVQ
jgi:trimeric autotransporter adhesin